MVGTRNHPTDFQEPELATTPQLDSSTRRRTTRSSTGANSASPTASPTKASSSTRSTTTTTTSTRSTHKYGWSHTPSNLTLGWLAISLPLVIWDTGYVLLRPLSMPNGSLHSPIWKPYALYGTVDYVYGMKAWQEKNGWTAAQGSVNALETALYLVYLYIVYTYGEPETKQGRGAPKKSAMGSLAALSESRTLYGRLAVSSVLLGYTVAQVTFWKTVLYWLIEAFSGFQHIGHNDPTTLLFLWIIPNGAWLILPAYMIWVFGQEIFEGLEIATESRRYR